LRGAKSFGGEPPKGLIYEGIGFWRDSNGGNTLGEVEGAEGGVHGGLLFVGEVRMRRTTKG